MRPPDIGQATRRSGVSDEDEWPTASIVRSLQATPARRRGHSAFRLRLALLAEAGFTQVGVRETDLHGTHADEGFFRAVVEEFARLIPK